MPKIKVLQPGYDDDTGRFELSKDYPQAIVQYDASSIKDCSGVALEVVRLSDSFRELNSPRSSGYSLVQLVGKSPCGQVKIDHSVFTCSGMFKARLCPLDQDGKQVGFCSDHFLLRVLK